MEHKTIFVDKLQADGYNEIKGVLSKFTKKTNKT